MMKFQHVRIRFRYLYLMGGALRVIYEADWASPRRIAYRGVLGAIPARAKLPSVSIEHS